MLLEFLSFKKDANTKFTVLALSRFKSLLHLCCRARLSLCPLYTSSPFAEQMKGIINCYYVRSWSWQLNYSSCSTSPTTTPIIQKTPSQQLLLDMCERVAARMMIIVVVAMVKRKYPGQPCVSTEAKFNETLIRLWVSVEVVRPMLPQSRNSL